MKKIYSLVKASHLFTTALILAYSFQANSQIPNSGFENWVNMGTYENPDIWGTPNAACSGTFFPVNKSTDHYPVSVGQYSIRLENNTSLLPPTSYCGLGVAGLSSPTFGPGFPITGHPTSLNGYYKFLPQGGDTMIIAIQLFNLGVQVAAADFTSTIAATSWNSFVVGFPAYATADSASLRISAYCTCGSSNIPHGNSVLLVDNLAFDSLISNLAEQKSASVFSFYPNPSQGTLTIQTSTPGKGILQIRNSFGQLVYEESVSTVGGYQRLDLKLESGIYSALFRDESNEVHYQRVVIVGRN